MNIAIIPARGGSKRIYKKNIIQFFGKPMIAYAIEVAKRSELFDQIVVSTDDEKIAVIARDLGAQVPFMRRPELSDDFTCTRDVIVDAIFECKKTMNIQNVCCIYPCSPLVIVEDIVKTYQMLGENKNKFIFPVSKTKSTKKILTMNEQGCTSYVQQEGEFARSQDLEDVYVDSGTIYWGLADSWINYENVIGNGIGYVIPISRSVDIDTYEDLEFAKLLYDIKIKNENALNIMFD